MSKGLRVLALVLLAACRSTQPAEDPRPVAREWTAQDEAAVVELAQVAAPAVTESAPLPPPAPTSSLLEIYVFDIGQADSMLVIGPAPDRKTLLIDLGEPTGDSQLPPGFTSSTEHVLQRIRELTGRDGVDYFVLTHYHSDHAGFGAGRDQGFGTGIIRVLSNFDIPFAVGEFIHVGDDGAQFMPSGPNARGVFRTIQRRMQLWIDRGRVGASRAPAFGPSQIDLGDGVTVDILAFAGRVPGGGPSAFDRAVAADADYAASPGDENDLSIALGITAGEFEMFTAGDLNGTNSPTGNPPFTRRTFSNGSSIFTNVEHHLVEHWRSTGRETDVEVYRANHHGSAFSSTAGLLNALDPELVLYSTGADHGHPAEPVVQRAARTARQFATTAVVDPALFTSSRGTRVGEIRIIVAADGQSYTINGERHRAFTNAEERNGDDESDD